MYIHEHQAKKILKDFGAPVSEGAVVFAKKKIKEIVQRLNFKKFVLKAQIHAGGRGKAGGIKIITDRNDLISEAEKMFGKKLITHQTGPQGREVKRIYIEEASEIAKEYYLSCLVDRTSSCIAFISSKQGGMDIEKVAEDNPSEIITTKINVSIGVTENDIKNILKPYDLNKNQAIQGTKIINAIYNIILEKDANLVEINPLILSENGEVKCLDAKMDFDDNALFRRPDIVELRDLNEEEPTEIEASKFDLAYIKLSGSIGCMVNGAGLAMATMDIIKFHGEEPANFLDVGGGASKEKVSAAFKLILSDKNVKGILINIFGGIMRCDVIAQGVLDAAKEINLNIPLVVRLAGTNFQEGKDILDKSGLKILSASDLNDAAKKIVEAIK